MTARSLRAWLGGRARSYARVVTALCLNMPFVALALARHLDGVVVASLSGAYAALVFVGYYALLLLVLVSAAFVVAIVSRRLAVVACGALIAVALFYLVVNGFVHRLYGLHVDAFWLRYLFWSYDGIGLTRPMLATAATVLVGLLALEWGLFRVAARLKPPGPVAATFAGAAVAAFLASQAIHIVAYERDDPQITAITPQLPFYYPIASHRNALRYGDLMPLVRSSNGASRPSAPQALQYPLRAVRCASTTGTKPPNILLLVLESWRYDAMDSVVTPNMYALGRRSSVFQSHFSSGNSTPHGIFGLFYGIHPTYWTAVKANAATIDNPVLIDALQANGYALGIYAASHFDRHKIKDTVFRGIAVHESFAGTRPDDWDRDLSRQLLGFMRSAQRQGRPFFGFAFYKSTHFSYFYPEGAARFRPSRNLNVALAGNTANLTPYLNDYRNAVAYVDRLLGELFAGMRATGLLDSTIVVITSDHGEEFNDNHAGYWGHTGNFTQYQTRVPMIVYAPGRPPGQVRQVTAHVDLPPTLLQEALRCGYDVNAYSNGRNLFGPLAEVHPLVIASYNLNHAIVLADDVYAVFPMHVRRYKLANVRAPAGPPRPDQMRAVTQEMQRFSRPPPGRPSSPVPPTARPSRVTEAP
jgi:membrane-anchored protein YejM (alkaline phosphatase superfamily)